MADRSVEFLCSIIPVPIYGSSAGFLFISPSRVYKRSDNQKLVARLDNFLCGFRVVQTTMSYTIRYRLANDFDENVKKLNIKLYIFFIVNTT